jgi:hypothetical protein
MWSFFQKEAIKNVVRGIIMLGVQSKKYTTKEAGYIYCWHFINYYFISNVDIEK